MSNDDFAFEAEGLDDELATYNDAVAFAEILEASSLGTTDAQAARWTGAEILLEHRGPLPSHGRSDAPRQPSTLRLARHVADHFDNRDLRDLGTLWRIVATAQAARPHASDDANPSEEQAKALGGENIHESERYLTTCAGGTKDEAPGLTDPSTSRSDPHIRAGVTDEHSSTPQKVWYYDRSSRRMHYSNPPGQSDDDILLCSPQRRLPGKPAGVSKRVLVGVGMVLLALLPAIPYVSDILSSNSPTVPVMASDAHNSQTPETWLPSDPVARQWSDDDSRLRSLTAESRRIGPRDRDFARPVNGPVAVTFGGGPLGVKNGIDIAIGVNVQIYAVADSTVEESGPVSGFGTWVVLRHADGTRSVYGRINRSLVNVGDMVAAGEQIAEADKRDTSVGPRLHFGISDIRGIKIDPLTWLNERGIGY